MKSFTRDNYWNQSHVVGRGEPLGSEVFLFFFEKFFFGKFFLKKFFWKNFFGKFFGNLFCAENSMWKWKKWKLLQRTLLEAYERKMVMLLDVGWRNTACTAKKLILTKNVHFWLQNWPFLTQNMGSFQSRQNFLKRTLFEAYKPKMVMLGEEMRPAVRKHWF